MTRPYIPNAGDLVWISFDPQSSHEVARRRPVLVLSPSEYNRPTGLALTCPITSRIKGYPFEVPIRGKRIEGVALADHVGSLDWRARQFVFVEQADDDVMDRVRTLLGTLLRIA